MQQHRPTPLCGPECKYRGLYEGTRLSLADLSGKFRESVGRYGRLRNNLISVMKRAFPAQFAQAERSLQTRMLEASDEMLIAYLTSFVQSSQQTELSDPTAGVHDLRQVLTAAGYDLPAGTDLASWAEAIRAAREIPAPAVESNLHAPDLVNVFDESTAPEVWEPPVHVEGDDTDLAALFDTLDDPSDTTTATQDDAEPAPADAADPPAAPDVPAARSLLDVRRKRDAAATPASTDDQQAPSVTESAARPSAAPQQPVAPWLEAVRTAEEKSAAPEPAPTPQPPPETSPASGAKEQDRVEAPKTGRGEKGHPGPAAAARDDEQTSSGGPKGERPTSPASAGKAPVPLKPQLFPSEGKSRRRKPKRQVKASAAPPGPRGADVPQAGSSEAAPLDPSLHDQFMAQVTLPHPVFTSDLAGLAGSEEAVEAWEQACRDDADSAVRFIPPKARHRARGSLVLPYSYARQAAAEFKRTWWASCLDKYRGARLYELAVLLHRVGPSILSFELGEHHIVLRCNQPRGMVGIVVTFDADMARNGEPREALVEAVESLLDNPLTMLAVLTTNHGALEPMIGAIEEEARERNWNPPFPVISSRSWEYAADQGHSAKLVLGQ